MSKQSKITNLIVMPLIASAIFLASPTAYGGGPQQIASKELRSGAHMIKHAPRGGHKGVAGTVTSINGTIMIVEGVDGVTYTVDATRATIMKASLEPNTNPAIATMLDIHVGDTLMVRGVMLTDQATITAEHIFDGKFPVKHTRKSVSRVRHLNKAK